ncbi:MAG: DUF1460 domain-containing protein [Syntrophaceae bacterium]|nr:DUF1460 domain-containing protein [Syntrophaceae bacterium]
MPVTDLISTPEDRRILRRILTAGRHGAGSADGGELTARLGLLFLGAPYEASTLEGGKGSREPLVINLQAFDCFTFVESVTALALTILVGKTSFEAFAENLERLRYRRGIRGDYASRLHYFTDWLGDNRRLGILRDVTRELGGRPLPKPIRYMSDHSGSYPPLADGTLLNAVRRAERNLSRRCRYFLPRDVIEEAEPLIREGDLIGVTTAAEGLDVVHAGLAVRRSDRLHLLHASRPGGGVVITGERLHRYVAGRGDATGIVAGRLRPAQQ